MEELPGANPQGRTLEEARENLQDAMEMIMETHRELGSIKIFKDIVDAGD